ncbi:MAG: DNA polymerase III subunit delta [Planctomycetales bacterium]|nr:DNA polymerase III subunit delta [Planctomycetales bacterium]
MTKSHCFEMLMDSRLPGSEIPAVVALLGESGFLRGETLHKLLELLHIEPESARGFDGEEAKWVDIHDELATVSLFDSSQCRVAVVNNADALVKTYRAQLEKWVDRACESSLLILHVSTFPSNTKLFKLTEKNGWIVDCGLPTGGGKSKTPSEAELKKWIVAWGKQRHGLRLEAVQSKLVLEAVGLDCGLLHQELAKLALYADDKGVLSNDAIVQHVGTWRTRTMWEIADAMADGRAAEALTQLERVFAAGEHPAAVVPQISWSLRRFGVAANLLLQAKRTGRPLSAQAAIGQCFWGRDAQLAEARLRRMGLKRASQILDWLLELDLKIKGSHSQPQRAVFAIEELCIKLAS